MMYERHCIRILAHNARIKFACVTHLIRYSISGGKGGRAGREANVRGDTDAARFPLSVGIKGYLTDVKGTTTP